MSGCEGLKPVIGITMGDPAGVGPELCLKAVRDVRVRRCCRPVVFGDARVLEQVAKLLRIPFSGDVIPFEAWGGEVRRGGVTVVDCGAMDLDALQPGVIQAACGRASYRYVEAAVRAALEHRIDAVATAPIHKESLNCSGIRHPGHTEILAELTGTRRYCMTMASADIVVSLVTTHVAYRDVLRGLTADRVVEVIRLTGEALRRMGVKSPRLTVCALNPHAGEHGLFGDEEARIIEPAIMRAKKAGWILKGPLPPDTAFLPACRKTTDAYIVMYHDQGLIPFKILAFEKGVNITLGLPIVRTSVDHGTAFDIAWKGKALPESMIQSVLWASRLSVRSI